jgi:hypothetical protein
MRLAWGLVVAAILTSPVAARADGVYVSEAFGPGAIRGPLSNDIDSTTFRFKLAAGFRSGNWALEPFVGFDLIDMGTSDGFDLPTLDSYGIDLKRIVPVSEHLSVYVRGSMSHIAFPDHAPCCITYDLPAGGASNLYGYGGRGLGVGVGAQLSGKGSVWGLLAWPLFFLVDSGPKMNAGIYLEDSYDYYRFLPPAGSSGGSIDASITRLTFGVAVGSDF